MNERLCVLLLLLYAISMTTDEALLVTGTACNSAELQR